MRLDTRALIARQLLLYHFIDPGVARDGSSTRASTGVYGLERLPGQAEIDTVKRPDRWRLRIVEHGGTVAPRLQLVECSLCVPRVAIRDFDSTENCVRSVR
ncbi:MAG: hypothetical protein ACK5PF_10700, partial [bacterium]